MLNNNVPRDLGDNLTQIHKRLARLELKGRGFSIPSALTLAGAISTYASDSPPPGANAVGSLWIDTSDGNKIYRWDGTGWLSALDPRVDIVRNEAAIAIASWQDAAASDDGLVITYVQASAPVSHVLGDLWVRTTDNALHRWNGVGWANQGDTTVGLSIRRVENLSALADGVIRTWWQFSEPTPEGFGDLWVDTSNPVRNLYRWNNFNWVQVLNWSIAETAALVAGKISSYYQAEIPTSTTVGDIWFDISNNNLQYRAAVVDATTIGPDGWVEVRDNVVVQAQADATTALDLLVPTSAPDNVFTVKVTGDAEGLIAVATSNENLVGTTSLDWYLDDVFVENTTSLVYRFGPDDGIVADTTYEVTVQPRNAIGLGIMSLPAIGQINLGMPSSAVYALVAAGFVLAGTIQVGNISIEAPGEDTPGGITMNLSDGGVVRFPADGSDAVLTAIIRAREIVVENHLTVQGQNNVIEGGLDLSSGVIAPTVKPNVFKDWNDPQSYSVAETLLTASDNRGLHDNVTAWVYCERTTAGGKVWSVDKTTGVRTLLFTLPAKSIPDGGITKVGTGWYVLIYDTGRSNNWYVYKYNSSWVKTGEIFVASAAAISGWPRITAASSTEVAMVYWYKPADDQLRVNIWNVSSNVRTHWYILPDAWGAYVRGAYIGTADFGATRLVVAWSGGVRVFGLNTALGDGATQSRYAAQDWVPPEYPLGLAWDGTQFHTLASSKIWHYGLTTTAVSRIFRYSWYDSNPTGGTHETQRGTSTTFTVLPRTWTHVEGSPPTYAGGDDEPDSIRIYVDNHLQADLGAGITGYTYPSFDLTGAAGLTTNEFALVAGAVGEIRSIEMLPDAVTPKIYLNGAGEWLLDGLTNWVSFTPVCTNASTGATVASHNESGKYLVFGDVVMAQGEATLDGSTTYPDGTAISLPVVAVTRQLGIGTCALWGADTPTDQSGIASMNPDKARLNVYAFSNGRRDGSPDQVLRYSVTYKRT